MKRAITILALLALIPLQGAITIIDMADTGHPSDDPALQLKGHLYVPDPAVHAAPWEAMVGTVADNFKTNNSRSLSGLNSAMQDLANHGYICLSVEVRLTTALPGQTTSGRWHQQTDDLKRGIRIMRSNPFGLGYSVTGVVGTIGGSGAAHHALYCALDGTNGDDKSDAAVCLSPITDMGDREADIVGAIGAQVITNSETYGNTTDVPTLHARSPITLSLVNANPVLLYNGDAENPGMPLSMKTLFDAAMAAAGGTGAAGYTSILNTGTRGTLHSMNYWSQVNTQAITWLDTNLVAHAAGSSPTPTATATATSTPQGRFPLISP